MSDEHVKDERLTEQFEPPEQSEPTPHVPVPRKAHMVRRTVMLVLATILMVAFGVANVALRTPQISGLVNRLVTDSVDVSQETKDATDARARETADKVEAEGAVLLQNDGTLPLSKDVQKVNVFGWASVDWIGGGSGSGGVNSVKTDLIGALNDQGIQTNDELTQMYADFRAKGQRQQTLHSKPEESSVLFEPSIDDKDYYSDKLLSDAKDFSDTAIVVIGRWSGESNDMPLRQYKVTTKGGRVQTDDSRTSLDLSSEEEALLAYVGQNYQNVIVVVNAANAMNLGPIQTTPGIDACLLAGYTGEYSASVLPKILWGDINPSGRTTDTYAYDLTSAPSYQNSSEHVGRYDNADGLYPADGTQVVNFKAQEPYKQVSYVDYAEGIYVGYRWYETADAEGFWADRSNEHGQGYDAVVQYPFGYGLSYTTFNWEVIAAPSAGTKLKDKNTVMVRVTNTGQVAGRDVVELYYSAPYTKGGIEKSAVNLGAFQKTRLLQPGESEDVTLSVTAYQMASYDCYDANGNGFAGFELDPGDYVLSLRHDAHHVDDETNAVIPLRLSRAKQFPTDRKTGAQVTNRFTGEAAVDGVSVDGLDDGQDIRYLSRADFAGTYPDAASSRDIPDDVRERNLYTEEDARAFDEASDADFPTTRAQNWMRIEEDGKVTDLGLQLGANYDDPSWEPLLDQLTTDEMTYLTGNAYSGTASVPSVGRFEETREADGPAQIGSFLGINVGTGFPCPAVLSQTWDPDLANQMGLLVGMQADQRGYSGWYAPTANIHRSPFDGRNYEYYAEDPLLTGVMCGNVVSGAKDAGIYCYVKHLICNDGEAYVYRDSVHTWMSEQTLREIYLEPFRMLVEDYGGTAIMTSYNRLGATWAGGSRALLTDVLRGEWGFRGSVITDFSDHVSYMNGDQMLRAGGDLWMQMLSGSLRYGTDSPALAQELRRASKDVLYTSLNARVANKEYVDRTGDLDALRHASAGKTAWIPIAVTAGGALSVLLFILALRGFRKGRRLKRALGQS